MSWPSVSTEMKPVDNYDEIVELINKKYNLKNEKVFIFVGRINALKNIFFIVIQIVFMLYVNIKIQIVSN